MSAPLCIFCGPEELQQGLFGQVFYYIMQLLPYLHERGIYPQWELRSTHYGDAPDFMTVPGVLDLAYDPPRGPYHRVSLWEMRRRHAHVLGDNWQALHEMWTAYFRTPPRLLAAADEVFPRGRVLGLHYRGTDKQTTTWDSNPISKQEFLLLAREWLDAHPGFDHIFAATDEIAFVEALRAVSPIPVVALGEVEFHLSEHHSTTRAEKADRAMLDCVLLSRCTALLETSSALPSFAKLLNPQLEVHRCAASKLFGKLYTKMPYFPVAHVPVLQGRSPEARAILERTMVDDWTLQRDGQPFLQPFVAVPRWRFNHAFFSAAERLGVDKYASYLFRGFF
jgi:hypothetical protein